MPSLTGCVIPKLALFPYDTVPVVVELVCHRITALLLLGERLMVIPVMLKFEAVGVGVGVGDELGVADGVGVGVAVG